MRHQTGLRNKFRSGRSPYSIRNKAAGSDTYGQWASGTQVRAEKISGHTLTRTRDGQWTSSGAVKTAVESMRFRHLNIPI